MSPWEETKKGVREQVGSLFTIYDGIQKNATTGSYDLYILNKVAAHLRITSTSLESSSEGSIHFGDMAFTTKPSPS
jgi:hypothetical protein